VGYNPPYLNYCLYALSVLGGESFPLDSCGGFAGDVVDYPVDAADFVDDSIGYYGEGLGVIVCTAHNCLPGYQLIFFRMLDDAKRKVHIKSWPIEMFVV